MIFYSMGHSNLNQDEFIDLLKQNRIDILVDVRSNPFSRFHYFNRKNLIQLLKKYKISYYFLGAYLGGRNRIIYPDYIRTEQFQKGINRLMRISDLGPTAYMCSEKDFRICHRRYISEYLMIENHEVKEIYYQRNKNINNSKIQTKLTNAANI